MNLRAIFYIQGILLFILAAGMMFPMIADMLVGNPDWQVFLTSILTTLFCGGVMILANKHEDVNLGIRETFLLTTVTWLTISFFGSLPLWHADLGLSFTDAFFETTSGITSTGATVISGLDTAPPGILLWRSILQWFGGIGIVVMAISILPFLKIGGMQLFNAEFSEREKVMPRIKQFASSITYLYSGLTGICALAYIWMGMEAFDAINHAMTTIATGGFSTHDKSIAFYDSIGIEVVAMIFMIMGGMPFVLYLKFLRGNTTALFRDMQVRWFLCIIAAVTVVAALFLILNGIKPVGEALRHTAFNVISVITTTGYANADYSSFGVFTTAIFFFLIMVGGCAGSTSCGIKIFRFQIVFAVAKSQFMRLLYPHGVFIPQYNRRPIPDDVPASVLSFIFIYVLSFTGLALALSFTNLDFLTALSGAAAVISNVGPGLGMIVGPTGNYAPLSDASKWILCFGMILGRLELFTVMVLFVPQFWRR